MRDIPSNCMEILHMVTSLSVPKLSVCRHKLYQTQKEKHKRVKLNLRIVHPIEIGLKTIESQPQKLKMQKEDKNLDSMILNKMSASHHIDKNAMVTTK